jgi:putative hydrolase of the HAD superfamily
VIKAIIFDYYGVLTTDSYMTWLHHNPEVVRGNAVAIKALSQAQDAGLSADEFFTKLAAIAGQTVDTVRGDFTNRGIAHEGLLEYIRHLRHRGYKTAVLSNAPLSLYDEIREHHIDSLFDVILCSEEAGVPKPDPAIFRLVLQRLGVDPAEALFVDDREYNVHGAQAVGITGVHYRGLEGFRQHLVSLGLDEE